MNGKVKSESDLLGNSNEINEIIDDKTRDIIERIDPKIQAGVKKVFGMEFSEFLNVLEISPSEFLNYIQRKNGITQLSIHASEKLKMNFHKLSPQISNEEIINLIENFEDGQGFINAYEGKLHKGDQLPILDIYETGKELLKELVFEKNLNPLDIRIAILKNLLDNEMIKILREKNPGVEINTNDFSKMLELMGINKDLIELTEADLMDIARERFKWRKWDGNNIKKSGNVAYFIYKMKVGGKVITGIVFSKQKHQELLDIQKSDGDWNLYLKQLIKNPVARQIISKLNPNFIKYIEEGKIQSANFIWHSEFKILMDFLYKNAAILNSINSFEFQMASELGYCRFSCKSSINNFIETGLLGQENLNFISGILRNDPQSTTLIESGVRNSNHNHLFFNPFIWSNYLMYIK